MKIKKCCRHVAVHLRLSSTMLSRLNLMKQQNTTHGKQPFANDDNDYRMVRVTNMLAVIR